MACIAGRVPPRFALSNSNDDRWADLCHLSVGGPERPIDGSSAGDLQHALNGRHDETSAQAIVSS
jgi:hypothetical protein